MKPALTDQEWADARVALGGFPVLDGDEPVGVTLDPHGVAALCLFGQEFGFTEEDVRDERQAYHDAVVLAREGGNEGLCLACIARAARHFDRANRIEALLPPREPDWDENEAAFGWPPDDEETP
ncbi:MAG TPA: hypothetical protein VNA25_02075 [Phycisphaerae bacterium]|nr:hypothetical protein [Phycisphaerae bacterium]